MIALKVFFYLLKPGALPNINPKPPVKQDNNDEQRIRSAERSSSLVRNQEQPAPYEYEPSSTLKRTEYEFDKTYNQTLRKLLVHYKIASNLFKINIQHIKLNRSSCFKRRNE